MAAAPDTAVLRAWDLHKSYSSGSVTTVALDGASFHVAPGELLAITGPSGSGKTTLLHCAAGIVTPDAGSVTVAGSELVALGETALADLRRDTFGFVFQQRNLLAALTVRENVELPLVLAGLPRAEVLARAGEVLAAVGLDGRGADLPGTLSGGQAQRAAIARALVGRPKIVFADEPTGALDSAAASDVLDLFALATGQGAAVILVTHDREVAARADRRTVIVDGRVVA